jgi:hypothetical protein
MSLSVFLTDGYVISEVHGDERVQAGQDRERSPLDAFLARDNADEDEDSEKQDHEGDDCQNHEGDDCQNHEGDDYQNHEDDDYQNHEDSDCQNHEGDDYQNHEDGDYQNPSEASRPPFSTDVDPSTLFYKLTPDLDSEEWESTASSRHALTSFLMHMGQSHFDVCRGGEELLGGRL